MSLPTRPGVVEIALRLPANKKGQINKGFMNIYILVGEQAQDPPGIKWLPEPVESQREYRS